MSVVWSMTKVFCMECNKHICSVPRGWSVPNTTILYCPKCAEKEENNK